MLGTFGVGQSQQSSPEAAWLWEWQLEGEEWCPASSGRVPFKTGFSNCYQVLWQLDLQGGPAEGPAGTGLAGACWKRDSSPQKLVRADLTPLRFWTELM